MEITASDVGTAGCRKRRREGCFPSLGWSCLAVTLVLSQLLGIAAPTVAQNEPPARPAPAEKPALPVGADWLRLTPDHEVWINTKQKKVLVGGQVSLRAGQLEMFACPQHTKEHESVVSVNTPARFVHAGLLAVGAKEGKPVQYEPEYRAAQGMEVEVEVVWKDKEGETKRCPAQQWVKRLKTGKALAYPWVFVGSAFWQEKEDGPRYYYADSGEFICVSNFSTAMLDLPVRSSEANQQLMFSAFTEHIPPRGTPVQLILTPKIPPDSKPESAPSAEKPTADKANQKEAADADEAGTTRSR